MIPPLRNAIVLGAVLAAAPALAQGRISGGTITTRPVAQSLAAEVRATAGRATGSWIGYRMPMVAGPRQMCCYDSVSSAGPGGAGICRLESGGGISMSTGESRDARSSRVVLEPATEFLILARLENGAVTRIRTFSPDCDVDASGASFVWLTAVRPDDSLAWLASLVTSSAETGEGHDRVGKTSLAAIALHEGGAADRVLEDFVASSRPEWLRGETAFWLGSTRGEAGATVLARMIVQDPSDKVRDKVTFGLSVSKSPLALTTLVAAARGDRSTRVRGQALFWLAQKAGRDALATISGALDADPDTEVKKKAVFALSQLPEHEGVPKLMDVARNNRNPEVRKQAMFWLGQSKDPRAVQFFEDILLKK
ncbi:MAG TPA: HEAT repeat domain-containing protein [Vicinamibacterales bacterium]